MFYFWKKKKIYRKDLLEDSVKNFMYNFQTQKIQRNVNYDKKESVFLGTCISS